MARIPFVDLGAEYRSIWNAVKAAIDATLHEGQFILGEAVACFDREMCEYLGVGHAIGVAKVSVCPRSSLERFAFYRQRRWLPVLEPIP